MRIAVVGAGALGSVIALGLATAGREVTLVARSQRLIWLRNHPIELERDGEVLTGLVSVATWSDLSQPVDLAFLCIKAGDITDVAERLSPHLAPGSTVVTLQNGVEAPGQAAAGLPDSSIVAGRVHGFFEMVGKRVRHVGVPPAVVIGARHHAGPAAEQLVCSLLREAGFSCETTPDIDRALWEKLMISAGLGLVAVANRVSAGEVCRIPEGEAVLRQALGEVAAVAQACGIALGEAEVEQTMRFVRKFPADATTSLQRDLAAGLPSEYDALVGAVLRLGHGHGLSLPLFERLDGEVRALSR